MERRLFFVANDVEHLVAHFRLKFAVNGIVDRVVDGETGDLQGLFGSEAVKFQPAVFPGDTVIGNICCDTSSGSEAESEETPEVKAFNIYSIGEDFKNRVQDFYPGYEPTGESSGMIGDVPIVWHVYADAAEYRDVLNERLGSGADPDEGVDLFVVEETYLRDYVESAASMDVIGEVGLTQEDLSDQFLYTQQMATDADGKLKAVSWQASPGVFAYRRSIAREVLGTDDPEKVQEARDCCGRRYRRFPCIPEGRRKLRPVPHDIWYKRVSKEQCRIWSPEYP